MPPVGGDHWLGGWHYMLNMVSALSSGGGGDVETILFVGTDVDAARLTPVEGLPRTRIVRDPVFDAAAKSARLARALTTGVDAAALTLFRREGIDVAFEPATYFGWRFPLPTVAWIPDFQHLRLPHLFSRRGRLRRSIGFRAQIMSGRTIMLSSADAEADCLRHYPRARSRTRVVRFAVRPPAALSADEARDRIAGFNLPARFVLLPNQFWIHKNHLLAVQAMARLKAAGGRLVMAMTGHGGDPRAPDHLARLQALVASEGLEEQIRFLGLVPYAQLEALMRSAAALLNPSRFEGWSTSVEEARAIGLPLVISDIAVHREQAGEKALYFDPDDAETLCRHLLAVEQGDGAASAGERAEPIRQAAVRHQRFGEALAGVFREASRR